MSTNCWFITGHRFIDLKHLSNNKPKLFLSVLFSRPSHSKHKSFPQYWFNAGPSPVTLDCIEPTSDEQFMFSGLHAVAKKQNVSSPLTRKDSILWDASRGSVLGLRPPGL